MIFGGILISFDCTQTRHEINYQFVFRHT